MLVYLHIPFCHRICPYCSFYKHTPGSTPIGQFIDTLVQEVKNRIEQPARTIYLGGGTPSMLSPKHLERLFDGLRSEIDFDKLDEVTLEANPATFDVAKARLLRELGVTRISLGIQSFTPHVLQTLGREHSRQEAIESVETLREAGIRHVNIDLMFSVPGQSYEDWQDTLTTTLACEPDHISAYNLTYEEDTRFFEMLRCGEFDANEDADAQMFTDAHDSLTGSGFEHYETSNYARQGCRSSHNEGYWSGEDYLGIGPSAVSTIKDTRLRNIADTTDYMKMVQSMGYATEECENLDRESWRIERIALGLRTENGIDRFLLDNAGIARAESFVSEGLAQWHDNRLVLVGRGRALVDAVAVDLL